MRQAAKNYSVDVLRSYVYDIAKCAESKRCCSDIVVLFGDQVYVDETSSQMQAFIRQRRCLKRSPGEELKDCVEYAHLYKRSWFTSINRWLLSIPFNTMRFDDHTICDDWHISLT